MASLRDVVSEYQDDLRNGIAWLAFWREGRSWQAEAFHLDLDDTLYPEDRARLAEIQAADPRAVVVNGYYSGYLSEEMSVAELAAGVRHHYDNGLNNIAPFMEAHSDELPPDVLEAAREKAHAAGLPFYERPYRGDDIDPYTYDGHMSIEDYELMQKLMEQDRERSEPMSEVFCILLHNRQRYEQGKEGLWFSLPTTTEKLQAALREIGISADNPQDFFLYDYRSPQARPIKLPRDMVLSAGIGRCKMNFDYTLYLVTDRQLMSCDSLTEAVEQAILGGCTMIQLREKELSSLEFYNQAVAVKQVTDKYHIPLIINDRIDIAMAVQATGVHIGQHDLPAAAVRKVIGENMLLGVSASSIAEAIQAQQDGADYLGVGAMFPTGTKTDADSVSMEELQKIRAAVSLPIVVIGGINKGNAGRFKPMGIDGLAVVSAIIAQSDIKAAAAELKDLFCGKEKKNGF